jgi:hypothetical protein
MKGNIENMFRTIADVVLQAGNKFAVGALLPLDIFHASILDIPDAESYPAALNS